MEQSESQMWSRVRRALASIFAPMSTASRASAPTSPVTSLSPLEFGRDLTTKLYQRDLETLWSHFAPPLRSVFGNVRGLASFRDQIDDAGAEVRVVGEKVAPWIDSELYTRTAEFARMSRVVVQWCMSEGLATGLLIVPAEQAADTRFADYLTRTTLRLPFSGEWFVFWGGRDAVHNAHAVVSDQRFASDYIVLRHGTNHAGDSTRNDQYYSFGQAVLAPGAGSVVATADGIADNRPGVMNARKPMGNHVIIDHSNGEFSFIAHLKNGSVAVVPGATVQARDLLGHCGNSGNSSEPHVHYHLQNTPHFADGEGLPAQFTAYTADGILVESGEPQQGQRVAPQP